ncbi:division/outer membrane stress-associated lipid-binding lipoprotein [Candidatus Regiella endosymbiont of Tuberolachnus salignus]|uniref:division/outer membrane stress-associated lipid-binding lipoprotein n=1 Tax=Candidatus Regiella endosymbiont of Tuberolachnus salignus TaxID=3077956 RepID=UPI0030CF6C27
MKIAVFLGALCGALLLQGCVSAVFVGGVAVATKSAKDPRTLGTQIDDGKLEIFITKALNKDPKLKKLKKKARVIATVYQKKVLLTGQVPDRTSSDRAKEIAMSVEGTNEIYNEIRQGNIIDLATITNDTWITTQIRSLLLASDSVKFSNVKVITENSEVFLLGLVTQQEEQAAADIASKVNGVKRVITVFTRVK